MINYVDLNALSQFKKQCDKAYAPKSHTHSMSQIDGLEDRLNSMGSSLSGDINERLSTVEDMLSAVHGGHSWSIQDCKGNYYDNIVCFISAVEKAICSLRHDVSNIYSHCYCCTWNRNL